MCCCRPFLVTLAGKKKIPDASRTVKSMCLCLSFTSSKEKAVKPPKREVVTCVLMEVFGFVSVRLMDEAVALRGMMNWFAGRAFGIFLELIF